MSILKLVRFLNTNETKITNSSSIMAGRVVDNSVLRANKHRKKYSIGSVWETKSCGFFKILNMTTCDNITIHWENTGHIQGPVSSARILSKNLIDESLQRDILRPKKGKHYVYTASLEGKIIYVGHGFNLRYLHCKSGGSHVIELNRLYFSGINIDVEIYKDDISKDEAIKLEKELIAEYKPYCNSRVYKI